MYCTGTDLTRFNGFNTNTCIDSITHLSNELRSATLHTAVSVSSHVDLMRFAELRSESDFFGCPKLDVRN